MKKWNVVLLCGIKCNSTFNKEQRKFIFAPKFILKKFYRFIENKAKGGEG